MSITPQTPQIRLMLPHPGQKKILITPHRFKVVACGRRFGKTELGKVALVEEATHGKTCWWLAPTYSMATQVWRDLKLATRTMPTKFVSVSEAERRMDFHRYGGSLTIKSTHYPDILRGAGLDFVVLDEAAFMENGVWSQVVRPMLTERRGKALFLSTPYGRNWFWELFKLGIDPHEPDWQSWHMTTLDNPLISPEEIESIRRVTPEHVFKEEYLAQFLSDSGQVFRGIDAVAIASPNAEPISGHGYVAGIDWGRENDYTAIAIIDATTQQMVALDRFREIGWSLQRGRVEALYQKWSPAVIWAESNSIGTVNIEALQADGLPVRPFTTTSASKRPLIEGLALAIERGEIALLQDAILLHELASYGMERLPGGGFRYGAPLGGHDDTVIATALAWHGVQYGTLRIDFA